MMVMAVPTTQKSHGAGTGYINSDDKDDDDDDDVVCYLIACYNRFYKQLIIAIIQMQVLPVANLML
jgi:hypothetical protein